MLRYEIRVFGTSTLFFKHCLISTFFIINIINLKDAKTASSYLLTRKGRKKNELKMIKISNNYDTVTYGRT